MFGFWFLVRDPWAARRAAKRMWRPAGAPQLIVVFVSMVLDYPTLLSLSILFIIVRV